MADYGRKIAALRKSKGMTQEDLGKVLSVTYQAVSKWERGEALPDFMMMSRIAKFFEVPLSHFEDGAVEEQVSASEAAEKKKVLGMCTVCGRMLEEGDEATTSPKIVCKDCHERQPQEPVAVVEPEEKKKVIGMCTVCGRMLEEGDEATTSPKIVCKKCDERQKQEALKAQKEKERKEAAEAKAAEELRQELIKEELGKGFDAKLIVALVLSVAAYVLFTILCFKSDTPDLMGVFLLLVPLALFGATLAICNFVASLRDKDDEGYKRQ